MVEEVPAQRPNVWVRWCLYITCFAAVAGFRYLSLGNGFSNDHFVYITGGWQMQFGEWPTRDWVDGGAPLMVFASAAAQAIVGPTLLAEALLVAGAFGLGAVLTSAAVLSLTGSISLAIVSTMLEVAVVPRTYGYPKMLVYAAAFVCMFRYVSRPSSMRIAAMSAAVVVAFLFRHDHGLFLGIGAVIAVLMIDSKHPMPWPRRIAVFGLTTFVLVLPYLIYVQTYEGLARHFNIGLGFSRTEFSNQWHAWPAVFGDAAPFASALVYEYYALPGLAIAVLIALRRHPHIRQWASQILPVIVVAMMMNYTFIREPLAVRLPDAIVPAVVLAAWLIHRARHVIHFRVMIAGLTAAGVALFSASVLEAGRTIEVLNRANLLHEWQRMPEYFRDVTHDLQARMAARQVPSRPSASLRPFYAYLDRCTTTEHRLLVGGFLVEVPFLAQRRFAGGQRYFGGSYGFDDEAERQALNRLAGQVVPFALITSDYLQKFEVAFPAISAHLRSRYATLTNVRVTDDLDVHIFVDRSLTPSGRDPETGWPCFR